MKVLILTGGRLGEQAKEQIQEYAPDYVIAADSGLCHARKLSLHVDEALGDFDSIDPETLAWLRSQSIQETDFPPEKDDTDTELALHVAMERAGESGEILLMAATGTRIDHSLANLFLLKQAIDRGIRCRMVDDRNQVELIKGLVERRVRKIYGGKKEYLSLLPAFGPAVGVTLHDLYYPLTRHTIDAGSSLGISNEIVEEEGTVILDKGYLFLIQSTD